MEKYFNMLSALFGIYAWGYLTYRCWYSTYEAVNVYDLIVVAVAITSSIRYHKES